MLCLVDWCSHLFISKKSLVKNCTAKNDRFIFKFLFAGVVVGLGHKSQLSAVPASGCFLDVKNVLTDDHISVRLLNH